MTTIDPRQQLAASLQSQVGALRARKQAAGTTSAQAAAGADQIALAQRLAAIDAHDPDRRRKAVRVVLEAELAREFGDTLLNDPAFGQMLDAVQSQMDADAELAAAVAALADILLARRAG